MSIDSFSVLSIDILFYRKLFYSIHSFSVLSIAFLLYRKLFCSIDSFSVLLVAFLFYPWLFCSIDMANIFELPSKDGNITPEKHVNRDKCSFTTKQCMFGVFVIDEIPRYRWTRFVGSRTLCHPDLYIYVLFAFKIFPSRYLNFLASTQPVPSRSKKNLPVGPWMWTRFLPKLCSRLYLNYISLKVKKRLAPSTVKWNHT